MMKHNFAAFILTNGRPDNVITYKTLKKAGYTGRVYIVIDNTDKTSAEYYARYGDEVLMFDKEEISKKVDHGDNFNDLRTTTHARNAIFDFAEELGFDYFIQLDDDYTSLQYAFNSKLKYCSREAGIKNIDIVFDAMCGLVENSPIKSVAMAQGGDFFGQYIKRFEEKGWRPLRKCMNSFVCSTKKRFWFLSRLNEDVNTYLTLGSRGDIFFSVPLLKLIQKATQESSGGMTETYIDNGTYVKSFFSVMYCPSFVKIGQLKSIHARIHHNIRWNNAVPKILSEEYKK